MTLPPETLDEKIANKATGKILRLELDLDEARKKNAELENENKLLRERFMEWKTKKDLD